MQALLAALAAAGWRPLWRGQAHLAAKDVLAIGGLRSASVALSAGDGLNRSLLFHWISEGRNVLAPCVTLIPVGASPRQVTALASAAAAEASKMISESFAVRFA